MRVRIYVCVRQKVLIYSTRRFARKKENTIYLLKIIVKNIFKMLLESIRCYFTEVLNLKFMFPREDLLVD